MFKSHPLFGISRRDTTQRDKSKTNHEVSLKEGIILSWSPASWTCQVQMSGGGGILPCTWIAGTVIAPTFGVSVISYPEAGTSVVVLSAGSENYIVGCKASLEKAGTFLNGDESTPFDERIKNLFPEIAANRAPVWTKRDRIGGEIDIGTATDVGVSFLRHLCKLSAGERAWIEASLLSDTVRIFSDRFEHISPFGVFKIESTDGRNDVVIRGSSKWWEVSGLEEPSDQVDDTPKEELDRFQMFLGSLGNMLHIFITDPGKVFEDNFRAGRLRIHAGEDGTFMLQSVSDIVFEKVVRVPVPRFTEDNPVEQRAWTENPDKQFWEAEDESNWFLEAMKLREYARWLSLQYTGAEFKSRSDVEWPSSESEIPVPSSNAKDPERSKMPDPYGYATIRIFRDGTIVLLDSTHGSIFLGGGVVSLSAKKVLIESAGDLHLTAGKKIIATSWDGIELASVKGSVNVKGETGVSIHANKGSALLESAASDEITEENFDAGAPVVIRAPKGSTLVEAKNTLFFRAKKALLSVVGGLYFRCSQALFGDNNGVWGNHTRTKSQFSGNIETPTRVIAQQVAVTTPVPVPLGNSTLSSLVLPGEDLTPSEDLDRLNDPTFNDDLSNFEDITKSNLFFKYLDKPELPPQTLTQIELDNDETTALWESESNRTSGITGAAVCDPSAQQRQWKGGQPLGTVSSQPPTLNATPTTLSKWKMKRLV